MDPWDSGFPPAYPIPVPDRVTPTYEWDSWSRPGLTLAVGIVGFLGYRVSRQTYRRRWKAKTVMSAVKRRWGESLSARLDNTRRERPCCVASSTT